ncbi:hypothetical protein K8I85_07230 [bacterium]|nr:hypothetical protein [bacterium]
MKRLATTLFAILLFTSPGLATVPDTLINGGNLDFDFVGNVNGHFGSTGSLVAAPATEGTAATTFELDGLNYLVVVGALEDGANFVDGGILIISSAGAITPGPYVLDGVNAAFLFVDDAVGWTPPADLFNTNWTNELMSIVASGKYGSLSGSVNLISVTATLVSGTFSCTMLDESLNSLTVSNGEFNVESTTDTDEGSWGAVKNLYR